ncbi:glycosyltransferase [Rhodobacterales bacterium FZCC0188]|nr:glycosyltransferase [Rhodobacterales bacterium FZCC0188]
MNDDLIKVFIGYDPKETIAWHTMVQSLIETSSRPLAIVPVNLRNLETIYLREHEGRQSNEFSFSRFLVPYLCNYNGWGIFFDCDMMMRTDVAEIFDAVDRKATKPVYVVKHDYTPKDKVKYLNQVQYNYPKKNWSSVVLWNCSHPSNRAVTLDYVNTASPKELHRFEWLADEEIGDLDVKWNWLVGEYDDPPSDVKNVHWTVGGPYFHEYQHVDFSDEWKELWHRVGFCAQRET